MLLASSSTLAGDPANKPFTGTTDLGEVDIRAASDLPEESPYRFQTASSSPNRTEGATRSSPRPNSPYGSTQSCLTSRPTIDAASRRSCAVTSTRPSTLKPGSGAV